MKIRLRGRERRCPLCRVRHDGHEPTYTCSECGVLYHRDCAEELGGCSTFGCPRLGLGPADDSPDHDPRAARWRRGLRAARERRRERPRLAAEHRAERVQSGQRAGFMSDAALDFGLDAGCCCLVGLLEVAFAGVLVGVLLFPPGVKVAERASPAQRPAPSSGPAPAASSAGARVG